MNYISKDELLKQPEKVQNRLIEYTKEKDEPHLYLSNNGEERYGYNTYDIPLLTGDQLIEFIEDTTLSKIDISFLFETNDYHDGAAGYEFTFYRIYEGNVWGSGEYDTVKIKELDKLKAVWQLACKVASEQ